MIWNKTPWRQRLAGWLFNELLDRVVMQRAPDFIIGLGNPGGAYMNRWYLTPWRHWQGRLQDLAHSRPTRWNRWVYAVVRLLPNLYLHEFLRDDDDRALHDHPSWGASFILAGGYIEHTIEAGGIHRRTEYAQGSFRFMPVRHTHRIELKKPFSARMGYTAKRNRCWTLFVFGPRVRQWGFHCPHRGWVHWREFTAADDPGSVGRGCD